MGRRRWKGGDLMRSRYTAKETSRQEAGFEVRWDVRFLGVPVAPEGPRRRAVELELIADRFEAEARELRGLAAVFQRRAAVA